jgi:hypothetical protein
VQLTTNLKCWHCFNENPFCRAAKKVRAAIKSGIYGMEQINIIAFESIYPIYIFRLKGHQCFAICRHKCDEISSCKPIYIFELNKICQQDERSCVFLVGKL